MFIAFSIDLEEKNWKGVIKSVTIKFILTELHFTGAPINKFMNMMPSTPARPHHINKFFWGRFTPSLSCDFITVDFIKRMKQIFTVDYWYQQLVVVVDVLCS